ncbi:hypothetical protein ACK3TF_003186 [Chlorella vulgaris]
MADEPQVVEKKLGMSLDELIAEQKKKQGTKPAAGGKKKGVKAVGRPAKGGGRVLVVPRPKNVPRPSAKAAALKGTHRGGVHKAGPAPKFMARQQAGPGGRQTANRNVKVTIGNKLSGRAPPSHIPTSGVLSKPFMGAGGGGPRSGGGGGGGGGRGPMQLEGHGGAASLSARFDVMSGSASLGPARPTGQPRRNAHGVLMP